MLCSKKRSSFEWKNGKTPRLTTNGKSITCTMVDNFVLLAVPGLLCIPAAVCLQHRDQRISEIIPENWDCYQIQSRSEVTSMHAGNRCWQILTSRPQETVNQHTIFSYVMYKEDPTQGIPDWLRTFLWKIDLRSGRWCFKSGETKMEAQHSYSLPQIPKEICSTNRRDWWLDSSRAQMWWSDSMKWYYYLQNVQDFLADGKSQNERRFGNHSKDQLYFLTHWLDLPKLRDRDKARNHQ